MGGAGACELEPQASCPWKHGRLPAWFGRLFHRPRRLRAARSLVLLLGHATGIAMGPTGRAAGGPPSLPSRTYGVHAAPGCPSPSAEKVALAQGDTSPGTAPARSQLPPTRSGDALLWPSLDRSRIRYGQVNESSP
jgi:hypothetical protein